MKIAVEMEIIFRSARFARGRPGRASFHAEDPAKRRFARGQDGLLAHLGESLYQAFSGDSLALAGSSERGCGNENQFSASRQRRIGQKIHLNLAAVRFDGLQVAVRQAELTGHGVNGKKLLLRVWQLRESLTACTRYFSSSVQLAAC